MNIEPVSWDSSFFGLRIGKLHVDSLTPNQDVVLSTLASTKDLDLVYVFSESRLDLPLEDKRCIFVDEKINFKYDWLHKAKEPLPGSDSVQITEFTESVPGKKLVDLALQSGKYSRFYTDRKFSSNAYVNLYTEWISRSVDKTIADKVLIAKLNDVVSGFITYKIKGSELIIGLFAVDASIRGKGIGQKLTRSVIEDAVRLHMKSLLVETQNANQVAFRFYERNGFAVNKRINVYHFWY